MVTIVKLNTWDPIAGRDAFDAGACGIQVPFVESAEMLQRFHQASPVVEVLGDSRALIAKTKDGRAVALVPVDCLEA